MATMSNHKQIVIVGGGFGGVRCALDLAARSLPDTVITLVSDKPHFEYMPTLYRVATGRSPICACIRLDEIFSGTNVRVVHDTITRIDSRSRELHGNEGARYHYDMAVLALGSNPAYFGIPGLEATFTLTSVRDALVLKDHLHSLFATCEAAPKSEQECAAHIVIVGAGPTGVELAGEFATYMRTIAAKHRVDPSRIAIEVVEAAPRILPMVPEEVSAKVARYMQKKGVQLFTGLAVKAKDADGIHVEGRHMKTRTVIWTAGTKPHYLYTTLTDASRDARGRIVVDAHLQAIGCAGLYVIGDGASTPYAGLAQAAVYDGSFVARVIAATIKGDGRVPDYAPRPVSYAIPAGPAWAAAVIGSLKVYGRLGWIIRRIADFRFFASILPLHKAFTVMRASGMRTESCVICK